jgi:hypothetical protein
VLHLIADLPVASSPIDLRIETGGQWTKGACVVDKRGRSLDGPEPPKSTVAENSAGPEEAEDLEIDSAVEVDAHLPGDEGGWLSGKGNRVWIPTKTGWEDKFGSEMLKMIFSL